MNDKTIFDHPEEYVISQDIKNPDAYLDKLLQDFSKDDDIRERILTIKNLGQKDKVAWILGLTTHEEGEVDIKMEPATGCIIVIITVIVTVVVGYTIIDGVRTAITEQQEREKKVKKCTRPKDEK